MSLSHQIFVGVQVHFKLCAFSVELALFTFSAMAYGKGIRMYIELLDLLIINIYILKILHIRILQCTVNAVNFAGLIFRVWQHKNIFAGC